MNPARRAQLVKLAGGDRATHGLRYLARGWKHARQRLRPRRGDAAALFVVGAQRSGTTMLLDALDAHPDTRVHHESDRRAYDDAWRLRPLSERRALVEKARCRWVVMKPLLDLQHLDRLLEVHPGSRAIFLVRRPEDVAVSSVEKWGGVLREAVLRVATGDPGSHWLAERLPAARRGALVDMVCDGLDAPTAAALRWWLRNELFFDLALDTRQDEVLPVRYETLVRNPNAGMDAIFAFLGLAPARGAARRIASGRAGRDGHAAHAGRAAHGQDVAIDAIVAQRCLALEARLDAVIAARGTP